MAIKKIYYIHHLGYTSKGYTPKVTKGYKTKANCFSLKIISKKDKLKFIDRVGSSNPIKYHNLVALSEMIDSRGGIL